MGGGWSREEKERREREGEEKRERKRERDCQKVNLSVLVRIGQMGAVKYIFTLRQDQEQYLGKPEEFTRPF